jgi:hypothetical protein
LKLLYSIMILSRISLPYRAGSIKLCRVLMIFAIFDDQLQSVVLFVHQQLCRTSWVSLINLTALGAFLLRRAAWVLYISPFLLQYRRSKLFFFFLLSFVPYMLFRPSYKLAQHFLTLSFISRSLPDLSRSNQGANSSGNEVWKELESQWGQRKASGNGV